MAKLTKIPAELFSKGLDQIYFLENSTGEVNTTNTYVWKKEICAWRYVCFVQNKSESKKGDERTVKEVITEIWVYNDLP